MVNKPFSLKKIIVLIIGIILFVVLFHIVHYYYETGSKGAAVGFQEYAPGILPPGLKVTNMSVSVWSEKASFFGYNKQFIIGLNQKQSFISEQKNKNFTYACDMYVVNQTCTHEISADHQSFLVTTSFLQTDTAKPFAQTVSFARGTTYIFINLQGNPVKTYDKTTWGKVVDSFKPSHYSNLSVKHYSPGP